MNHCIFRQYDIRGKVGEELFPEDVSAIGKAFGKYISEQGRNKLILGRDNRSSSLLFHDLLIEAFTESGLDVVDIGEVITPVFYFASRFLEIDAGVMITASHNPASDNGFKLLVGESTIFGKDIQQIGAMAARSESISGLSKGTLQEINITQEYIQAVCSRVKLGPRKLKVVVDCGNGTAGYIAPLVLRELGCEVIELYCESNPTFPNHHPDPVKIENCQDLIRMVEQESADLGIGLDGDGDRLGVVDKKGNIIWGDLLMILFWREILPQHPGIDCIVEVKCSQALIDEIVRLGGKPLIYKTGHSLIKSKMKEIGAIFTGEMSGHMFFADEYYGYDDAIYAGARLLRVLSNSKKDLSEILSDIPVYYTTPEIRVKTSDTLKFQIVDQVKKHFQSLYEIIDIDGARIIYPGGWGLIRASNTGPELIVRCEGKTPEDLDMIKSELFSFLGELGLELESDPISMQ
jgi:phosphomannomutase/phosphoglucomutase